MAFDKETMQVIKKITIRIEEIKEEIKKLKAENEKLRKCAFFYSNDDKYEDYAQLDWSTVNKVGFTQDRGRFAMETLRGLEEL